MPEDAGVNTLAPHVRVREMQTKLHRWAVADHGGHFHSAASVLWRAGCGESRTSGVRREALRCIPDAVGMNSEGGSWVA